MKRLLAKTRPALVCAVIAAMVLVGIGIHFFLSAVLRENLRQRLSHVVRASVHYVDPEVHGRFRVRADEELPAYRTLRDTFRKLQTSADDIAFVYTVRRAEKGETIYDIASGAAMTAAGGEILSVVNSYEGNIVSSVYPGAPELIGRIFDGTAGPNRLGVFMSEDFYTDAFGTFLTGYTPLRDKAGHITALFCTDILAESVIANEKKCKLAILGMCGFIAILAVTFALTMKAEKTLRKQNAASARFVPTEFLSMLNRKSLQEVEIADSTQKDLAILFSDIRSYTQLSEGLAPKDVFDLLNEYFSQIILPISEHHGFIDKFIGDAIMALFPERAEDALAGAIQMRNNLVLFNEVRVARGKPPVETGMGLHFGRVTLGTVGTKYRMQTTVIGDSVNLASRIESLTKVFKAPIILSDRVYDHLANPGQFHLREIDIVRVKGKEQPITIYEAFDCDPAWVIEKKSANLDLFKLALSHYRGGAFGEAVAAFKAYAARCPEDPIAEIYVKRSSTLVRVPPGPAWQGVSTL